MIQCQEGMPPTPEALSAGAIVDPEPVGFDMPTEPHGYEPETWPTTPMRCDFVPIDPNCTPLGWVGPGPQSGPLHNQVPPLPRCFGETLHGNEVPPGPFAVYNDFVPADPHATEFKPPDPSRWSFGEVMPGDPHKYEVPPGPQVFAGDFLLPTPVHCSVALGDPNYDLPSDPHFKRKEIIPIDPNRNEAPPLPIMSASAAPLDPDFHDVH